MLEDESKVKITCHVKIIAKPGKVSELLDAHAVCANESRKEPGCEYYEIIQNIANPLLITLVEKFSNYDAFKTHFETPAIKHFIDHLQSKLVDNISNSLHVTQIDCNGSRWDGKAEDLSYRTEVQQ